MLFSEKFVLKITFFLPLKHDSYKNVVPQPSEMKLQLPNFFYEIEAWWYKESTGQPTARGI